MTISALDGVLAYPEEGTPRVCLKFEKPFVEAQKRFVADRFDLKLSKNQDKELYEEIQALSDGYFPIMNELAERFNKQTAKESIAAYFSTKKDEIEKDMRKYLEVTEEQDLVQKQKLIQQRRETLLFAIDRIINQRGFGDWNWELDWRYFIIIDPEYHPKLKPLHPIVIAAAKQILSDINVMKQLIESFTDDLLTLGFILEKLVLMSLPKTTAKIFPLYSSDTGKKVRQVDFARKQTNFITKVNDFNLDDEGYTAHSLTTLPSLMDL